MTALQFGATLALIAFETARIVHVGAQLEDRALPRHRWRSELIAASPTLRVALYSSAVLFASEGVVHVLARERFLAIAIFATAAGLAALVRWRFDRQPTLHVLATHVFGMAALLYVGGRTWIDVAAGVTSEASVGTTAVGLVTTALLLSIARTGIVWPRRPFREVVALMTSCGPDADTIRAIQGAWVYALLIAGALPR